MKKLLFGTLSTVAILGSIFALSNPAEAISGRYITLTSSDSDWTIVEGKDMTVTAEIHPSSAKISDFTITVDKKVVKRCNKKLTCSYTLENPSVGKHSVTAKATDTSERSYFVNKDSSFLQNFTVTAKKGTTPTPTPVKATPAPTAIAVNLNPGLSITPNVASMKATDSLAVRGDVTNANGVWGMEIRALPSWTNVAITHRCILDGQPKSGTCSMNTTSFAGHAGGSVKVWVIYWDAKTGLGYASAMKTISLTK